MGSLKPSNVSAQDHAADGEDSTAQLVDQAIEDGYTGTRWEALQERLARGALKDLAAAIQNGSVFQRCARAGFRLYPEPVLQQEALAEEIAAKAVSEVLLRLRDDILAPGRWDPALGTLEALFAGWCLPYLANAYKKARRHLCRPQTALDDAEATLCDPGPSPDDTVITRDAIKRAIAVLGPSDSRALVMQAYGWSLKEIAAEFSVSTGAIAVRLSRARCRLRAHRGELM